MVPGRCACWAMKSRSVPASIPWAAFRPMQTSRPCWTGRRLRAPAAADLCGAWGAACRPGLGHAAARAPAFLGAGSAAGPGLRVLEHAGESLTCAIRPACGLSHDVLAAKPDAGRDRIRAAAFGTALDELLPGMRLHVRRLGDTRRALSLGGGRIYLPRSFLSMLTRIGRCGLPTLGWQASSPMSCCISGNACKAGQ